MLVCIADIKFIDQGHHFDRRDPVVLLHCEDFLIVIVTMARNECFRRLLTIVLGDRGGLSIVFRDGYFIW